MARRPRNAALETRTARLRLPVQKRPQSWTAISIGVSLGYRRCKGPGRWVVRAGTGNDRWEKNIGAKVVADDYEDANGEAILNFWQAQDKARALARGSKESASNRPATVAEAIDDYEKDLLARGAGKGSATHVRHHMTPSLASQPVALLTSRDLKHWRDKLLSSGMTASTFARLAKSTRACLNLAAKHDRRIQNRDAWGDSLGGVADTHNPRNDIRTDDEVRNVVAASYAIDAAFGLYVETMAETGNRQSQIAKLVIADLQDGNGTPRLLMPSSRKGRGRKVSRRPVPVSAVLAAKLRQAAGKRPATAPLLLRSDGEQWQPATSDHSDLFAAAAEAAGLTGSTMYCLRHSSIVRQLLRNVPIRLVADTHDTSVAMIEKTYSRYIAGHGDALIRSALIDLSAPPAGNVVSLPGRRS